MTTGKQAFHDNWVKEHEEIGPNTNDYVSYTLLVPTIIQTLSVSGPCIRLLDTSSSDTWINRKWFPKEVHGCNGASVQNQNLSGPVEGILMSWLSQTFLGHESWKRSQLVCFYRMLRNAIMMP